MIPTWTQTYSGRALDLVNPDPSDVDPVDIAHSLGRLCRYSLDRLTSGARSSHLAAAEAYSDALDRLVSAIGGA